MVKKRVFISFDYEHDFQLKANLVGQSHLPDSPFAISDFSLTESFPESEWQKRAKRAIRQSDIVVVVLGLNTHSAPGVQKEVSIARSLQKPIFQIRPKGKSYGPVKGAGDVHSWKWKNLKRLFA